jgi:hypothetical protein
MKKSSPLPAVRLAAGVGATVLALAGCGGGSSSSSSSSNAAVHGSSSAAAGSKHYSRDLRL